MILTIKEAGNFTLLPNQPWSKQKKREISDPQLINHALFTLPQLTFASCIYFVLKVR